MRPILATTVALCAAGLLILCRPLHIRARVPEPQVAAFPHEGIALTLEGRWVLPETSPSNGIHPATLNNPAGTIRVMLLPSDLTTPVRAAAGLEASLAHNPEAVRRSARRDEFVTESGLPGIHVSFSRHDDPAGESVSHHYLAMNRAGRCVAISYTGAAQADTTQIDQMIRRSLRWQ